MKNWKIDEAGKAVIFLFEMEGVAENENGEPENSAVAIKVEYKTRLPEEHRLLALSRKFVERGLPGMEGYPLRPITEGEYAQYDDEDDEEAA
ncbi:hypothetical protein SAMN05660653_00162 [Desulfonatronum thiosulfatophilum]|uniref:Uncharacterized protein n=1 Tax=Desulfonatronum thiosulfatophilum TaxID=617002 RepID=A0A1G6A580_9BACT|nr:hypothetical protein [Desulfonatronum thiosulfatophilum]SDB03594.1 hypothetical protein SAMN05660653_00162 [Desulfonatronum thiosulfatophilum]